MSLGAILALSISAAGVAVAMATLLKAYDEYSQQGRQRRTELFFSLRARLKDDDLAWIAELVDLAMAGDLTETAEAEEELAEVALRHKRDYVGLFEEVCVLMDDGQIEPELAHYMFGYYALLCDECLAFWNNIGYDSPYWSIFHRFCATMRLLREALEEDEDPGEVPMGAVHCPGVAAPAPRPSSGRRKDPDPTARGDRRLFSGGGDRLDGGRGA